MFSMEILAHIIIEAYLYILHVPIMEIEMIPKKVNATLIVLSA